MSEQVKLPEWWTPTRVNDVRSAFQSAPKFGANGHDSWRAAVAEVLRINAEHEGKADEHKRICGSVDFAASLDALERRLDRLSDKLAGLSLNAELARAKLADIERRLADIGDGIREHAERLDTISDRVFPTNKGEATA